ncbi:MAG: acyltransferase family protein [Bacilli bacterium]|nr:acyltransferase family protein [Bacilli bacterium]
MHNLKCDNLRNSNIELLRILAIIMIIFHHFSFHGGYSINSLSFFSTVWLQFIGSCGKISVNLFILISGYFLINSKSVKINKFLKLIFQILFYLIVILAFCLLFKIIPINTFDLKNYLLKYNDWWFARSYLALYLIHPYVSLFLNSLSKEKYRNLLIFSFIFLSIIPTITNIKFDEGNLIWFIFIYSLGGYISKYPIKNDWTSIKYFIYSLILLLISFIFVIIYDYNNYGASDFTLKINDFFRIDKLVVLLISLFIFLGFLNLKIKNNKYINIIASCSFGIYLIHDSIYIRNYIWKNLFFKPLYFSRLLYLIPYSIVVVLIVFIVCCIIELIRIYLVEKLYLKSLDKLSIRIEKGISKFLNWKWFKKI